MPSNSVFKSRCHAKRAGNSESSKVFEIEQCMYNLSEDFLRQTSLNDRTRSGSCCSTVSSTEIKARDKSFNTTPSAHRLWDIVRLPISDEIMSKLCFSEMLLVCDGNDCIVGGAAINVSLLAGDVLAVFSTTRLTFRGQSTAESELMSFADRNCRPLQEKKCETLVTAATRQEKQIQLYFEENDNVTAYRQECNGLHTERSCAILETAARNSPDSIRQWIIIPDGLQLLLLRYLVLNNFAGEFVSQTVDVQGRVGNCIHKISPAIPLPGKSSGQISETMKEVRKTIWYSEGSEPEESVSHYSATGRLLRHVWNNSSYVLISSPLGSAPPINIMELERSIQDYVAALSALIKNHSSVKELIADIHSSVKEMDHYNQVVNPILFEIINEL